MLSRALKALCLVGGGVLAFGGGAAGTHFSYPFLEKNLFPKRINNENKMKESFDYKKEQEKKLRQELDSQKKLNLIQQKTITDLDKEEKSLKVEIHEKDEEISRKDADIANKKNQIDTKERENKEQKDQIDSLGSQYSQKTQELETVNREKGEVQSSLDYVKTRLALKREDILTQQGLKFNPIDVKIKPMNLKNFSDGLATFETTDSTGNLKEFKVKKPEKFTNHVQKAKEIWNTGISFKLHDSFKKWDKSIELVTYDADYFFKATEENHRKSFIKNGTKKTSEHKITDFFQEDYLEDAFRILIAIDQMDNFPICHVINSESGGLVEFCKDPDIKTDFSEKNTMQLSQFTETEKDKKKASIWTNVFKTTDDIINYWIDQTVYFVRTGKVDFWNVINPILFEENYQIK